MLLGQVPEAVVWAIYFAPVASTLLITAGLIARRLFEFPFRDAWAGRLTILAIFVAFLAALWTLDSSIGADGEALGFEPHLWLNLFDLHIEMGVRIDGLSAIMAVVVTSVSLLVQIYSVGYMHGDSGYARYFAFMSLFTAAMLGLVLASSLLQLFVHWELVGLASYLLIGFWFHRPSAAAAAKKAFIVTRFGDFAFLLAVLLIFGKAGTFDISEINELALAGALSSSVLVGFTLGLLSGAIGKSAQFPLHIWLPDAMEGPTPVSALIHAATMVVAGVYLIARMFPSFEAAPAEMLDLVAYVGGFTALLAAVLGLVQTDIKRVLAYSTVSQLGYMFLATGVGAFAAGAFHLMTHAFFKALLFLGSGSVIHAMNEEQDMRKMGAMRLYMPVTFMTMGIGTLAIAGIPPFSGFFSKDEILYRTFLESRWLWGLAAITAGMTAFYMARLMFMTFYGEYRGPSWGGAYGGAQHEASGDGGAGHEAPDGGGHEAHGDGDAHGHAWHGPHESPKIMTLPLQLLALGAIVAGFVGVPSALGGGNWIHGFLEPSFVAGAHVAEAEEHHYAIEWGLMALSVLVAAGAIAFAWRLYVQRPEESERLATDFAGAHRVLTNKYYVDELYDATAVKGTMSGARGLWTVDRNVVDGAVNGTGWTTRASAWVSHVVDKYVVDGLVNLVGRVCAEGSYRFRWAQTGLIQNYALATLLGVFAVVTAYIAVRYFGQ